MRMRRRKLAGQGGGSAPTPPVVLPTWHTHGDNFDATSTVVLPLSGSAVAGTYIGAFVTTAPGSVTTNDGGLTVVATTTLTPTGSGGRMTFLEGTVGAGNTPGTPINIGLDGSSRWYAALATTQAPAVRAALVLDPINSNLTTVPAPSTAGLAGQLATYWHGVLVNTAAIPALWTPDALTTELEQGTTLSGSARNATALLAYERITVDGATPVRVATVDQTVQRQAGVLLLT